MKTPTPPVWLLDVDGVVNATRPGWSAAPMRRTVYADGEWTLRWAPALVRRIRHLVAAGHVELRWCTTWCPHAGLLERLWGLPELPRTLTDDECWLSPGRIDAAKVDAARKVRADGRRLIWTDDTAVPAFGPLHEELTADGRALLIRPVARVGLLPLDMDRIEAFAAAG